MTEFDVLHALRVKGLSTPAGVAAATGLDPEAVESTCDRLVSEGLALKVLRARGGYLLTSLGKETAVRLLAQDTATVTARDVLAAFDVDFLPVNAAFKDLCLRWQVKPDGSLNDHSDADYDRRLIAELRELHGRLLPCLSALEPQLPRFGCYVVRFEAALSLVLGGDLSALAKPMSGSYHDIWMELHQDVLLSLGRQRTVADGD